MNQASGLLLDADVVADVRSDSPDPAVIKFLRLRRHQRLYLSVLTIGELYRLEQHAGGSGSGEEPGQDSGQEAGREWVDELQRRFPSNILPIDSAVAMERAPLAAVRGLDALDSLIAATALRHRLTVVCRDAGRFAELGLNVVTPFSRKS